MKKSTVSRDYVVVQRILSIGIMIACTPPILKTRKSLILGKLAGVLCIVLGSTLLGYCMYLRVIMLVPTFISKSLIVIWLILGSSASIISVLTIGKILICYKSCLRVMEYADKIEKIITDTDFVATEGISASLWYSRFLTIYLVMYSVTTNGIRFTKCALANKMSFKCIAHLPEGLGVFSLIYTAALLFALAGYFERRYTYLIKSVESLSEKNIPENILMMKIKRMEKLVRCLHIMMESVNEVFGWIIFFSVVFAVCSCLYSIGCVLSYFKLHIYNFRKMWEIFIDTGCFLVLTITIILAIDRVQAVGKQLPKSVIIGKRQIRNEEIRQELCFLARYSEELAPNFTAGCFMVDRHLLSSSFSAIATYLIVIIQFSAYIRPTDNSE